MYGKDSSSPIYSSETSFMLTLEEELWVRNTIFALGTVSRSVLKNCHLLG